MNRRSFINSLATFTAGTMISVNVSAKTIRSLVGVEPLKQSVQGMLTKAYNDCAKGVGYKNAPKFIFVGKDLFEAFKGELMSLTRYSKDSTPSYEQLKFKSLTMIPSGSGWAYKFTKELDS